MKEVLQKLFTYKTLSKEEARDALVQIAQGKVNQGQIAAFLTVYNMRAITVEEMEGFKDALLEMCIRIDLDEYNGMDVCGTGGDGKNTFNISTVSAFVVAGAGQYVVKHGNTGVSSVCGSSNLMAYLGYQFTSDPDSLRRSLDAARICFLHAPLFHPAMKNVGPVRKDLAVKTFFNMLGPMVNPSFPQKQLVGVFSLELARLYGYIYQNSSVHYVIVHSLDGYDEISLTGKFKMIERESTKLLSPEEIGLQQVDLSKVLGGENIEKSAGIFEDILRGNGTKEQNEVVIANAGMALYCGMELNTVEDGLEIARESLMSGRALESLKQFLNPEKKIISIK